MKSRRRHEHLDRSLHRLLLGCDLPPTARLLRLDPQHPPEWATELFGLDERADDGRQLGDVDPIRHLAERLSNGFRRSEARRGREGTPRRAGHRDTRPSRASAASKPRPASTLTARTSSASGKLAPHLLTTLPGSPRDNGVRPEEANGTADCAKEQRSQRISGECAEYDAERDARGAEDHFRREEANRRDTSSATPPTRA